LLPGQKASAASEGTYAFIPRQVESPPKRTTTAALYPSTDRLLAIFMEDIGSRLTKRDIHEILVAVTSNGPFEQ
jgi:hypothetical protein